MPSRRKKNANKDFTVAEQELLYGLSNRIAEKHGCSGMYVRFIINGQRDTKSKKAQEIVKDLHALLDFLRPET